MFKARPTVKFEKVFEAVSSWLAVRALDPYHKNPFDQPN